MTLVTHMTMHELYIYMYIYVCTLKLLKCTVLAPTVTYIFFSVQLRDFFTFSQRLKKCFSWRFRKDARLKKKFLHTFTEMSSSKSGHSVNNLQMEKIGKNTTAACQKHLTAKRNHPDIQKYLQPKSDFIYHFPIDSEPNGIPFGSESIEKR